MSSIPKISYLFAGAALAALLLFVGRVWLAPDALVAARMFGAPFRGTLMQPEILLAIFFLILACSYVLLRDYSPRAVGTAANIHFWFTFLGSMAVLATLYLAVFVERFAVGVTVLAFVGVAAFTIGQLAFVVNVFRTAFGARA
jgi:hypothetical protein